MEINKSSRHSKIAADFGEHLVLYWLSKSHFECAPIDHTGIDLIARHPTKPEVMGISVKSRTRTSGTENDCVLIKKGEFSKVKNTCEAFGCLPYFAFVVDADSRIQVFITTLEHFLELCPRTAGGGSSWKMSDAHLKKYASDPKIMWFELRADVKNWWI
jgi:hypothetical protein